MQLPLYVLIETLFLARESSMFFLESTDVMFGVLLQKSV